MDLKLYEKLNVQIPDGFQLCEKEDPITKGSDYCLKEQEGSSCITVLRTNTQLENTEVAERLVIYQRTYKQLVPGFVMGELRVNSTLDRNVAIMTYKSNAPEKDMFNILAVTSLDEKELLMLLTCDMADAINNIGRFLGILNSLEFVN